MQVFMGHETFTETTQKGLLSQTMAIGIQNEGIRRVTVLRGCSCVLEERVNIGSYYLGWSKVIFICNGQNSSVVLYQCSYLVQLVR